MSQILKQPGGQVFLIVVLLWTGMSVFAVFSKAEPLAHRISVAASDFKFHPSTLTVHAGQAVSMTLTNTGVQEHEWVLLKQGAHVVLPFDEDDEEKVFWEIEAGPGATKEAQFTAPIEPGVYTIVCGKPRHIERGMKAKLVVE